MKIIVAGATGFIGTGVIREALSDPAITSIVALGRRQTAVPESLGPTADPSKLKSVICDDFLNYSEAVKRELVDADGCIWLIGIGPYKSRGKPMVETRHVCLDYTATALETLSKLPRKPGAAPLRFIYGSGDGVERDPSKKPWVMGDYVSMRGQTETRVLELVGSSSGAIEAAIARPGWVHAADAGYVRRLGGLVAKLFTPVSVTTEQLGAALVKQAAQGIEKELLLNDDLVRIGQQVLDQRIGS